MKKIILFFGISITVINTSAQTCSYFPADCPETGNIQSARDSDGCIANLIIPQEIIMQNNLRMQITSMMEEISKRKNWELYEFAEAPGAGIGIEGNTKPLPYPLRHPYQYTISFDFIVNEDSLHAWQNWYYNELKRRADETVESYKQVNNSSEQPYIDSSMYYTNLMTKYMSDHASEYQKAIMANDAKYQNKYNDELKKYQDKIDHSVNKANGKRDENFSAADFKGEDLETYKKRMTIAYRNASIVRVSFNFNNYTTASMSDAVKISKTLTVPFTTSATLFHNNEPDDYNALSSFLRSTDFAFLLFGKWITKLNKYNSYDALYRSDSKANDAVTVKKIPCDKVQTINVIVEGDSNKINEFLQNFDPQKLNALIVKE